MAYDNKTVLDLVKKASDLDLYNRADKLIDQSISPVTEDLGRLTKMTLEDKVGRTPYRDMHKLSEEVLSEENPLVGGTFKGSQYFSNLRPQGKGDEKFSVEAKNIIDNAFRANRTKKDVLKAQEYLAEIEYIHPSEIDGKFGEQTRKALNRLRTNMNKDPEALYHAVRDINIFKRDK